MLVRRLHSPDPVLHRIAPFGLAAATGTALVIDLDPDAPPYPGPTLADLAADGLTARHLRSSREGVAVIANGGVNEEDVAQLVTQLSSGWPAVVFRAPTPREAIPVLPLEPDELRPTRAIRAVWQASTRGSRAPGVVLPPLSRATVRRLCRGQVEPRHRWVKAWAGVWGPAWT
ncbi:MAG: hypothetical protein ACLGHX_06565 [Acidimicrobiia bacterium]